VSGHLRKRKRWTDGELVLLAEMYPSRSTAEVAKALGCHGSQVYAKARKIGVKKTQAYLSAECRIQKGQSIGKATQYTKGRAPANKGTRRPGWHSGRMQETQFKKGSRTGKAAINWRPIGTILPDPEGYLRIKVREAKHGKEPTGFGNSKVWPMYNRWLWEQHKGPIPPKHLVVFKDGNRANCVIDNLALRSMADNARLNQMWNRLPRDLADAIHLNGQLKRRIRGKEQNQ